MKKMIDTLFVTPMSWALAVAVVSVDAIVSRILLDGSGTGTTSALAFHVWNPVPCVKVDKKATVGAPLRFSQ